VLVFLEEKVTGFRWTVRSDCRDAFLGPEGLRLPEWRASGQATPVKHGPHRTVWRVGLSGMDCHVKHYRIPDRRTWLREWLRPGKARGEFERSLELIARGVPTVSPLAVGEAVDRPGESFLITATVPDARPLGMFLEGDLPTLTRKRQTALRQRLAVALGRFLALLHDAGVTHHDLHPGNLLLHLDGQDVPRLFLIDLHLVRLGKPLSWRASRANLIVLNRWFLLRSERTDRLRFWRAYHQARQQTAAGRGQCVFPREPIRSLERASLTSNLRFWRWRDRRCLGTNRYFRRLRAGNVVGHVVTDLDSDFLAKLRADPEAPFRRKDAKILKHSASSTVVEMDCPGPEGSRPVIYKRFACTARTDSLASLVRQPPALRSFVLGHALLNRRLPTAVPLAVFHRRRFGLLSEGYLLTEKIADALDLRAFVQRLASQPAGPRQTTLRNVLDAVARLVRTLHQRRVSHRDLKAANVLLAPSRKPGAGPADYDVCLIDLVGVSRPGKLRRARRVQNLARLNASFHNDPLLTRTDRLRFLRVYLHWGLRGRLGWKRWWRQIAKATADKISRNVRNGRVLG
jgi:tRNA A-37 threonylcarbamoyl transferase component Bud32